MPRQIQPQSLAFIVANEEGRINWQGISMNPYVFKQTFLLCGGQVVFKKDDVPRGRYKHNIKITEEMIEESRDMHWNPVEQIRLRTQGLLIPQNISNLDEMSFYRDSKTGKGGYFHWLVEGDVKNLESARIEYEVVARRR